MRVSADPQAGPDAIAERVGQWMFEAALPLWTQRGLDRQYGGCVEALDLETAQDAQLDYKRTRVAGRQLYVFSHAALLGWTPGQEAAVHAYRGLVDRFWGGRDVGWHRRTDRAGALLDATPDLYDYAFALFSLGWYHRLSGEREPVELAHATLDLIDTRFRHPQGGFLHEIPAVGPRQQNPHMHLIEAALVLAEATGEQRFADLANEVRDLFLSRFVQLPSGNLPEFYSDDLLPVAGDKGRWIEPGHQMEWAWILAQHSRVCGADNSSVIRALMTCAEDTGFDAQKGWLRNGVRDDGRILDGGSRTWPNTERIKGWIAVAETFSENRWSEIGASVECLFKWHLNHPVPGAWQDAFSADGTALTPAVPASTLYHVFLAFAELRRHAGASRA